MRMNSAVLCLVLCLPASLTYSSGLTQYTNRWVTEIEGGAEVAENVAQTHGYRYIGPAAGFPDYYIFELSDSPIEYGASEGKSNFEGSVDLKTSPEVKWAEQERLVTRSKRNYFFNYNTSPRTETVNTKKENKPTKVRKLLNTKPPKPPKRPKPKGKPSPEVNIFLNINVEAGANKSEGRMTTLPVDSSNLDTYSGPTTNLELLSNKTSNYRGLLSDPLWLKQWYLHDYRTSDVPVMDLNVVPVWKQGYTGKGLIIAVVDDGVQKGHPDLEGTYDASMSYDMVHDIPGSEPGNFEVHGTACAGIIGMIPNNSICGVGVAYGAKVIGIKVLGANATDYMEARGLAHKIDKVDVYSNSWGPTDNGMLMEYVDRMTNLALKKGVTEGRNGKGSLYLFAAGNGKAKQDNCGADGLINNAHTIPIASVTQRGKVPYYSERCSAIYAATYSSGSRGDEYVTTISTNGRCNQQFSGTSAATPLASGIVALTLNANPNLTERDIKHIITMSTEIAPVANNPGIWYKNGRGFWVSHELGFGLLNAGNMVKLAMNWVNVPKKHECVLYLSKSYTITTNETTSIYFRTRACQGSANAIFYLEQLEVASKIQFPYRGAITLRIQSPSGTTTTLLEPRPRDASTAGLNNWSIKSVHTWGEDPRGIWQIYIRPAIMANGDILTGVVQSFTVTFHGTMSKPSHYTDTPRTYAAFRLPNGKTSETT